MSNSQTKIFVDCHVFDGSFQGTTTYLKGLYTELIKEQNIHFFLAANDVSNLKEIFGNSSNITYLKYSSGNKFYRLLIDIPRFIRANKIEYAHFQYIVPPIKFCKYINTIHDVLFLDHQHYFPFSYRFKNNLLFKWSAKYSDIVLTVSQYSKEKIEQHFKIKDITITPNGVDSVYFEDYDKVQIQSEIKSKYDFENYWIYVSRWEPRKNHHTLLKVFVENKFYNDYHLVLVGQKAIPNPEFLALYNSLPKEIKDKIVILNKVNFKDMMQLIRGAKLSVYPSLAEGFGIPPLESTAIGIPSISSNLTAMSDFKFLDNLLFNPKDEKDFVQKINNGLAKSDVEDLRNFVKNNYSWQITKSQFLKALEL